MNNYQELRNLVQDLIDNGTITIEGHHTNNNHQAFKNPLPNYQKGESSNNKGKSVNNVEDNIICHIYVDDQQMNVIKIKERQEYQQVNMTTRGKAKVVFKGTSSNKVVPPPSHYNIVDQLRKTSAQISILELLKISPIHKNILEEALVNKNVNTNLDVKKFQAMVGHFSSPTCLSFLEKDEASMTHPHNSSLCLEVMIHRH
jgi:hypothetical protein